jgi:hypothetical protein
VTLALQMAATGVLPVEFAPIGMAIAFQALNVRARKTLSEILAVHQTTSSGKEARMDDYRFSFHCIALSCLVLFVLCLL